MKNWPSSLIFAWVIFLFSEVFAALTIYNLIVFDYVIWNAEEVKTSSWKYHMCIMGITMIVVNGHGMVLFRLLPKVKTVTTKYIHGVIHTVILVAFLYAYYHIHVFMDDNDHPHFSFTHLHTYLGLLTMIVYIFQFLTGIGVYICMFSNQRRRKLYASLHNFTGVCILQLSIATSCVQFQEMDYEINTEQHYAETAMVVMIVYGVLINLIVLNPYLEWRLVGAL